MRAFVQALRLTLRGQTATPAHYRPLEIWMEQALELLARVQDAAGQGSQDLDSLSLMLDGRPVTLLRSLDMLRHNLVNEYPRLIRLDDPFSMMVVQSSNFNDQYRLSQFLDADMLESPAAQRALAQLNEHLQALPEVEGPQTKQQV